MSIKRITADIVFVLHAMLFPVVLFGWLIPGIWYFYMTVMALTLLSALTFGYCILSKWEFVLRRQADPSINYNYTWSSYYLHRFTDAHLPEVFWKRASIFFLVGSLVINIFFRYF